MPRQIVRPLPTPPWANRFVTYGVTGTNGKTSTTFMLDAILRAAGNKVLRMSTIGYALDGEPRPRPPGGYEGVLQLIRGSIEQGATRGAMEVTSLALSRGYAAHWRFDHAIFTNLSPDHLKTHGTYEHYLAAKSQLFIGLGPGNVACFNAADPHALFVETITPSDVRRVYFHSPSRGPALVSPTLAARAIDVSSSGTHVELAPSPAAEALGGELRLPLIGAVFAENALAAAVTCWATGIDVDAIKQGLRELVPVPGRFELVSADPLVVIDYAHDADALARTLLQARELLDRSGRAGPLVVVFGAGGGASPQKRGPMGRVGGQLADHCIITNDNPRDESPDEIACAIEEGLREVVESSWERELDRRRAIEIGVERICRGGLLVIAGKGHEVGQRIGGQTVPHSDRDCAIASCRAARRSG